MAAKKKKKGALAQAASKKLAKIAGPQMSPDEIAHVMYHAEERGEVRRVDLDDGSWAWLLPGGEKEKQQILRPTKEILAALAELEHSHQPH